MPETTSTPMSTPPAPARLTDPKRLLGVRLVGLGRRWRQTLDGQLAADGLSDAAWTPLVHLLRLGDGLSQSELAAAVGIDGSSLVRLLDLLVSRGWIERRAHAQDRRVKRIYLTAQGRQTALAIRKRLGVIEDALLADLDHAQAQAMLEAFDRIEARMAAASQEG